MRVTRVLVVAALCLAAFAGIAHAEDPVFVDWTSLFPTLTSGYDPNSANDCVKGHDNCVHSVIREMTKRFDNLADACDHDAIFSIAYLRTTEEYHRAEHEAGFFEDPNFVNHEDAVFAGYYFDAFDAWHRGDLGQTPAAWQVALDAADHRSVNSYGNAFLGMNAHINRDLAFVLWQIGLVKADGTSRKADHDKVNVFLNRVSDQLFPEVSRRFDPTFDDIDVPGSTIDNLASFQTIPAWREAAWRNAERLANATSDTERAQVAQSIEDYAYSQALSIKASTAYSALDSSASRDAYCAIHHND